MDPFDQTAPWSMESIRGCAKFLDRVWNLQTILNQSIGVITVGSTDCEYIVSHFLRRN